MLHSIQTQQRARLRVREARLLWERVVTSERLQVLCIAVGFWYPLPCPHCHVGKTCYVLTISSPLPSPRPSPHLPSLPPPLT
jgi:hypothetical protein